MPSEVTPRSPPAPGPDTVEPAVNGDRPPEKKIDLGSQWWPPTHRSGWGYALASLGELAAPGGVLLDGFIEKKFGWGQDPGDARNNPAPYTRSWVGFWHNPPQVPAAFNAVRHAPADILGSSLWAASLPYCRGLFTLSAYLRRWLEARVPVPVRSLIHPTGPPAVRFSRESYLANPRKRVIQVGWWLRRPESVYALPLSSAEKAVLAPFPDQGMAAAEPDASPGGSARRPDVSQLRYLADRAYDELLSRNIVFLDLYDSSANNTIVECIIRGAPVLVNPLPAVVEYLGAEYPLYFQDLREAGRKADDTRLVLAAHDYLRRSPIQHQLTGEAFRRAFAASEIYRDLPPPASPGRPPASPGRPPASPGHPPVSGQSPRMAPPPPRLAAPSLMMAAPSPRVAPPSPTAVPAGGHVQSRGLPGRPGLSIFSSVYAADGDLHQFMANICGQTAFGDCEFLLFDICCSHRDPAAVRDTILAYQSSYRNIRYMALDTDPGLYEVWNRAIGMSRAPILTNANLDDRRAPDAIEQHLAALREHSGFDIVCAEVLVTTVPHETWSANSAVITYFADVGWKPSAPTGRLSRYGAVAPSELAEFGLDDLFLRNEAGLPVDSQNVPHCMPLWRASLHQRYGTFDPRSFGPVADWEFWIRCALGGARFAILRRPLGLYYVNPSSHNRRTPKGDLKAKVITDYLAKRAT
jgi:hypothetical protein